MLQGFTRCAPNTTYTLPFSILVSETVLHPRPRNHPPSPSPSPSSILVTGTVLRSPFFVLRSRNRPPSSSPLPFSILVPGTVHHPRHLNRSPSPFTELFHRNYSALFIRFVSQPRLPQPSSVHVFSSVHRIRLPSPSSIPVFFDVTKKSAKNRYL